MASGRRNPPLFDMLDRSDDAPPVAGTRRPDPARAGDPARPGSSDRPNRPDRAERARRDRAQPEPAPDAETAPQSRPNTMTLPQTTVWAAAAVAVAVAVVTWTVGYNLGFDKGRQEREAGLTTDPALTDPLLQPPVGTTPSGNQVSTTRAGTGTGSGAGTTPGGTPRTGSSTGSSASTAALLVPPGTPAVDPRVAGENYLALADLPRNDAQRAIEFLETRGVRAIAVPAVDSGGGRRNNPTLYRVFSVSLGVPGNQFSRLAPQRRAHEAQVREIGTVWSRDHEGASDFRDPQWTRYNG